MRQTSPRPDHSPRPLTERLDAAARSMNPFLAAVAVVLMLLNFACALSLINWQVLPVTPDTTACPAASSAAAAHSTASKPPAAAHPGAAAAPAD